MAKRKKNSDDFFWVSYADLMTTLFFIMLTLFVVTVVYLKIKEGETKGYIEELESIVKVKEQFAPLQKSDSGFEYLENCDKYVASDLIGEALFLPNETYILPEFIEPTIQVGKKLKTFLDQMRTDNPSFKYLVVLEGNMANDLRSGKEKFSRDSEYGYYKSYQRALAVYNLWIENKIDLRGQDDAVEILICGSGFNGLCRDANEDNNKRFSVQIIPKVKPLKNIGKTSKE